MRTPEELERVAFKEPLTPEEDDRLTDYLFQRSLDEPAPQRKKAALKQAAFFAVRAFDKGMKDPERLARYIALLTTVQPVVFRPHDGASDEIWPNFAAWVEECWLGELDE